MKKNLKSILWYVVFIGIVIGVVALVYGGSDSKDLTYSDMKDYFYKEQVREFVVDGENVLTMKLEIDGVEQYVEYKLRYVDMFYDELGELVEDQYDRGIIKSYDYPPAQEIPWWVTYLPPLILIAALFALGYYVMKTADKAGGGGRMNGFGKAKIKTQAAEKSQVRFADVAGAEEEKQELEEIVEYLHNPSKFVRLGAKIPHGVLLVGPPGTGKTLLAKAVAGEAGVPFFSLSGSDFVEMYVGVGASRVRDLFETARKYPASIIFIDEIDAVGRHRGAGLGGGHDEREQTLNQLLVEMDGFGTNEGVIVMAATNRPDILDPALLRPGRFDRRVKVGYPDINERAAILRVHAKNKPMEEAVDLFEVARTTVGFAGADLANLLNEAALIAARKDKSLIGMEDIEEASIKVIVGAAKKSHKRNERDTKLTAYHETGHAITMYCCPLLDPVKQISIIPTLDTGGYTLSAPVEDKSYSSREEMRQNIISLLGGRVAEELIMGDVSTGASSDISRATSIARNMVMRYGMSDVLGTVVYGSEHGNDEVFLGRDYNNTKNYSEKTAAQIDDEIRAMIDKAYKEAKQYLLDNMDKLHFVAQYLIDHEIMDDRQFAAVMEGTMDVGAIEALADERRRRSDEENRRRAEENAAKAAEEAEAAEQAAEANATDAQADDTASNE